jgi:hypothetical protein
VQKTSTNGGVIDDSRARECEDGGRKMSEDIVEDDRKLYQPRFPESVGGKEIFGIHVLKIADREGWVLQVTSTKRKEAYAVAKCDLYTGRNSFFLTRTRYQGHVKLCQLLRDKGIRGRYLSWLEDYEAGKEPPRGNLGYIQFECDHLDEEDIDDWTIEELPDPERY